MTTAHRRMPAALGYVVALLAALALAACEEKTAAVAPATPTTPTAAEPTPACFTGGTEPQLDLGDPLATWVTNDPHVLKVDGEYWMYVGATIGGQFPVRIYRLVSSDGATWSADPVAPVLDVTAGAWDAGGVETPGVVVFGGQYHLFYTGYPQHADVVSVLDFRIGHATSSDGVTFSKDAANPVVTPGTADWDAYIVAEPGPVLFGDQLHLYFTALGIDAELARTLQVIGVTTSADAASWSTPQRVLRPAQAVYPRGADWIGYSTPNAVVLNGALHLFFDVAHQPEGGDWLQLRLHHARSADGLTGWVQDDTPIRTSADYDWTEQEIRSPHALLDGNTLRLYFAGHDLSALPLRYGIGMLTCELGS